ncbi:uncharacterized protein LOC141684793 [Apium graveolens]|uniref:uncharacterized protein LOC141684793 n=1 Tax=Apium graveolens TaxID=4045 RepID=UPI003D7A9716
MAGVMEKFIIASMFMWIVPVAILYGFNHGLFPGSSDLSSSSLTLLSGFLAVISVNVVIVFYICLAMREPVQKHEPDPKFLSEATASVKQFKPVETGESSSTHKKEE